MSPHKVAPLSRQHTFNWNVQCLSVTNLIDVQVVVGVQLKNSACGVNLYTAVTLATMGLALAPAHRQRGSSHYVSDVEQLPKHRNRTLGMTTKEDAKLRAETLYLYQTLDSYVPEKHLRLKADIIA
jgi:hypothetical protein